MDDGLLIITNYEEEAVLLQQLLRINPQDASVRIVAAGGWSAADTLGRSILVTSSWRVILFANSPEQQTFLESSLGQVASGDRFRVLLVFRELTSLLFHVPEVLERLLERPLTSTERRDGQYYSLAQMCELFRTESFLGVLIKRLPLEILEPIHAVPLVQELQALVNGKWPEHWSAEKQALWQVLTTVLEARVSHSFLSEPALLDTVVPFFKRGEVQSLRDQLQSEWEAKQDEARRALREAHPDAWLLDRPGYMG